MRKVIIMAVLCSQAFVFSGCSSDEDTVTPFCTKISECNTSATIEACQEETQRVLDRLGNEGDCGGLLEKFESYVECVGEEGQCTSDAEEGLSIFAGVAIPLSNGIRACDAPFSEYLSTALDSAEVCQNEVFASLQDDDAPAAWTCDDAFYGKNGRCDCGCGIQDPECTSADNENLCDQIFCANGQVLKDGDTTTCVPEAAPEGWSCRDSLYRDGTCDCGCGIADIDCAEDVSVEDCTVNCTDGKVVDATDLTQCVEPEAPGNEEDM